MWGGGEGGNTSPHFLNFKYLIQDFASLKSIDLATGQCYKTIILGTEKLLGGLPSYICILGPYVLNILATLTSTLS